MDFGRKHEEDLQRLRGFRLLDDDFMTKVFEDRTCAEFLLKIILDRDDLHVVSSSSQHAVKNLQGRSVRLDILAVDRQNRVYNIEIQRNDKGAGVKRARYNSSLMDANVTEPGEQYNQLNETFVIFITERDVLGDGLPIYHIDRTIRETGKSFGDESHIIYVNSQIKDETALGKLMHDFSCTNAKDMYYGVLADRVHFFKEDEKGVAIMCKAMEEMRNETRKEERMIVALRMLKSRKLSYEEIAEFAGLTVDEVKELDGQRTA
ncbi:MAG: PD-(D/E)XK nuclease family transposase [Faecousia sp.]